jgi:GNAT superfamily N-acetyltransferase
MTATLEVQEIGRSALQCWLPQLDAWLLPGAFYGVQHTWPQLYRSDGHGRFFVLVDGDRLVSHCAVRTVGLVTAAGPRVVNLLGSVVTDPAARGRGHASAVLSKALAATAAAAPCTLLWAEHPTLYARAGFVAGAPETCVWLARRPRREPATLRLATLQDHPELTRLHAQKPWRVERAPQVMSGLLTTPGLATVVLERDGRPVAYACCGKGADLQGHWHELGGTDEDLAVLLPAALHLLEQTEAAVLLPPYRPDLAELLGPHVVGTTELQGPMRHLAPGVELPACWIDGLDSV